eukprot:4436623-Lingulodinium_polyedra.AAC.1
MLEAKQAFANAQRQSRNAANYDKDNSVQNSKNVCSDSAFPTKYVHCLRFRIHGATSVQRNALT